MESSKSWPKNETYSLIDQSRRTSKAIGANITEAWPKMRYPAHFTSKLTDSDGEIQETLHSLESADTADLLARATLVGRQIGSMNNRHEPFCF